MTPELLIRPARPEDKAAVLALSAHIWEGEDYVPYAFAGWVADPVGEFSLAFEGDTLLGFAKLTRLGPGEWWMEGLRVHPDRRGRGVARRLHHHLLALARTLGPGVLRFATNGENTAVHHLAASSGFRHIGGYTGARIAAIPATGPASNLRLVSPAEEPALRAWLSASAYFAAAHGLYEEHWTWLELLPRLERLLADGLVHWWQEGPQPAGVVIFDPTVEVEDEEQPLRLSYLDVSPSALPALTGTLRGLAASRGLAEVTSRPLALDHLRQAYTTAGWEVKEYELWIFECPLPAPASVEEPPAGP